MINKIGIRGKLLQLLAGNLEDREQRGSVRKAISSASAITSGVPRGASIIGPLIFIVAIDDLPGKPSPDKYKPSPDNFLF